MLRNVGRITTDTLARLSRPSRIVAVLCSAALTFAACGGDGDGSTASTAKPAGASASGLEGTITVFAAASLSDALSHVGAAFEEAHPDMAVELSFAGSSALREQILAGAPADVFASADASDMDQVVAGEAAAAPSAFAVNDLQIVVPTGNPAGITGLVDFADSDLLIGLCAAEVPCGRLGREALAKAGIMPAIDTDEPDARALLTKVETGELDAGIVYSTDVLSAGDAVEGVRMPADQNVIATYLIAALTDSGRKEAAEAFVDFVLSDEAQAILASYGFDSP